MRKITIDWSYPMNIDNILNDSRMSDIGIYYIYNLRLDVEKIAQGIGYAVETVKEWLGIES